MKRSKIIYPEANGRSFKIVIGKGKAPFKLLFLDPVGNETRRTHHKTLKLAYDRAAVYNPNIPVIDATN